MSSTAARLTVVPRREMRSSDTSRRSSVTSDSVGIRWTTSARSWVAVCLGTALEGLDCPVMRFSARA